MTWICIGLVCISFGFWGPILGVYFDFFQKLPHIEYWDIAALLLTLFYNLYFFYTELDDKGWKNSCDQTTRRCIQLLFLFSGIFLVSASILLFHNKLFYIFFVLMFTLILLMIDQIITRSAKKKLNGFSFLCSESCDVIQIAQQLAAPSPMCENCNIVKSAINRNTLLGDVKIHHDNYVNFRKSVKYTDAPSVAALTLILSFGIYKTYFDPLSMQRMILDGMLTGAIAFQMIASNVVFAFIFSDAKNGEHI